MNKIKVYRMAELCIVLCLFSTLGLASNEFQQHELEGIIGESTVKLKWSEPHHLEGSLSGGTIKHADYSWTFSKDFSSIKVTTTIGRISSSYILKREDNIFRGVAPSAFGMGQDVEIHLYPNKVIGKVALDKVDIEIDPPLKKGEIPQVDWIFEQE
jgi:hypothetical protein